MADIHMNTPMNGFTPIEKRPTGELDVPKVGWALDSSNLCIQLFHFP